MTVGQIGPTGEWRRPARILAYCHDGVGVGHLRRTLNICEQVGTTYAETSFLVATGSPFISLFAHGPRVDHLKLPALTKIDNETYRSRYLTLTGGEVLRWRESLLLDAARHFAPDVVLVDKAPVGVCGELISMLRWLRKHRPDTRIVFGMRDIEDEPEVTIRLWRKLGVQTMLEDCFDEIWIYGMRSIFDAVEEYRLSPRIRAKLRFMGYVTRGACDHPEPSDDGARQVLVTVGGGTDGTTVLKTYLAKAATCVARAGFRSVVIGGPDLPSEYARSLRDLAGRTPNVEWHDFVPCMPCQIRRSDLVVCMGGYNTLCEVAAERKRALVIPRTQPRVEQAMRADRWARRGIVNVLMPAELTPGVLADRVAELTDGGDGLPQHNLNLKGLIGVCECFGALLNGSVSRAAAVPL